MGYYTDATICLNGHIASSAKSNYRKFCKECGSKTISTCQKCNTHIQGTYETPDVFAFGYDRPSYCHECGHPYPWTSQIIDNALELISLDDDLPSDHKEIIKNTFPDLVVETPTTPVAAAKYKKYISKSAEYIQEGMKNLLIDVVTENVKKSLWG
ncbi:DUF2321 domain-containing protein [Oceanobacillus sp. FSL H7-0719]|uniref:DUF2321 domain-containing protein n=1 Tax=Oceanobacillus sp. FSL H7-0719 TaxID=2954507 RepID=UPI00324C84F7